ncbi:MAG TPA: type II toxin-antitoxin system PemK/MazF family toxin [Thermoanaerobaculia bacterium]|nr:type II toxin-antitoxin system PemK/MazF family toxin [Thermoanaerobaculia bacterium]
MKRGEVWWADPGPYRPQEQTGRRPVIVWQSDTLTRLLHSVLVIPLATNLSRLFKPPSRTGRTALLAALCLAAAAAGAVTPAGGQASQPSAAELRRLAELVNKPVVYTVPGMDRVKVRKDIVYKKTDDPNMKMDLYTPVGSAPEKRPAVIFLHGGAATRFQPKEWGFYQSWGRLVAASGMAAVTFTYRSTFPASHLADSGGDVADAIAYVRANADSLGIDRDRLCLASYSAGGPMLAPYLRGAPEHIRCLVAFYSLMDVRQPGGHEASEPAELLARFSPVAQLEQGSGRFTPIFVAQGRKDEVPTLLDTVDRFAAQAFARGVPLTLMSHPDAPHAFDNQIDDNRTREIVRASLDFLRWHLGIAGEAR